MPLNNTQIRALRKQVHSLKPVVIIGQHGLTESVLSEIDQALEHHELMKVRVNASDRAARQDMIEGICQATGAELIQSVGHIAALFRRRRNKPSRFTTLK